MLLLYRKHPGLGLIGYQMRYDTPMSSPQSAEITKFPVREQIRQGFKEMGRASWSSAKNFGIVGAVFSGTECCIEGVSKPSSSPSRHHHEPANSVSSYVPRTISTMVSLLDASQVVLSPPKQVLKQPPSAAPVSPPSVLPLITTCACPAMILALTPSRRPISHAVPVCNMIAF